MTIRKRPRVKKIKALKKGAPPLQVVKEELLPVIAEAETLLEYCRRRLKEIFE
jgi:hypothetical protein